MMDYNNVVDQIINLAPPYYNENLSNTTKKVKIEKKEEKS
jgi:hypothetical protein